MSYIRNYILSCFSVLSFAQQMFSQNGPFVAFPHEDGFLFIESEKQYFTTDGVSFDIRTHSYDLDHYRLGYVPSESGVFFVSGGGGKVYRYENDSLTRIDRSFDFQTRYGAYTFSKADTIIAVGGSGQFTTQNNIIYFTPALREWLIEYRFDYRSDNNNLDLGQYNSDTETLYFTLTDQKPITGPAQIEVQGAIGSNVYRYNFKDKEFSQTADLKSLFTEFFPNPFKPRMRAFNSYIKPLIYHGKELWTFDFELNEAYRHTGASLATLLQYEEIMAYNPLTNDFLLAHNLGVDPHFLVINESVLLGLGYETYLIDKPSSFAWYWLLLLVPPLGFFMFRKRELQLIEQLPAIERGLKQRLSEEDYKIYEMVKTAYPQGVEYPDLQSSFERELSYESRIKKLRSSIVTVDETIQSLLGRRGRRVFSIHKGKEDKRVKVIRLVNEKDSKWVSVFKPNWIT